MKLTPAFLTSCLFCKINAWGSLGHRTVTALALLHLDSNATTWMSTLLNNEEPTLASLYPDRIRYVPSLSYTAPWHFIDAQDSPPQSCSVNFQRDCLSNQGCIISAIANHTERIQNTSLPLWQRGQSLKFVLHFLGDVHQPLHTENLARGGNEIKVVFDGHQTNLHSVWDSFIPAKQVQLKFGYHAPTGNETQIAFEWAQHILTRYGMDDSTVEATEGVCVDDAIECALGWARESNQKVCEYILVNGMEWVQSCDLGGEYFEGGVEVVETMIMKGGRRLAAWLKMIGENIELPGEMDRLNTVYELEHVLEL